MFPLPVSPAVRATAALVLAVLLWSGNFIAGRALRGQVDPAWLNLLRWTLCLALMLPWGAARAWRSRQVLRREWRLLLALGATGIAAFHTMVYAALAQTTATNALLVLSLVPVAILLASWASGGPRPAPRQWLATLAALAGCAVLLAGGQDLARGFVPMPGDAWMLAAVPTWAAYALLLRRRPADLPQDVALAASTVAGIALLLPVVALSGAPPPAPTPAFVAALFYTAAGASLAGFLLWSHGVSVLGPERAGQFVHLMPLFGAALAGALLGETFTQAQLGGAATVLAGIALGRSKPSG
jgi:drug/metabolite transporter (DMT)-like permease